MELRIICTIKKGIVLGVMGFGITLIPQILEASAKGGKYGSVGFQVGTSPLVGLAGGYDRLVSEEPEEAPQSSPAPQLSKTSQLPQITLILVKQAKSPGLATISFFDARGNMHNQTQRFLKAFVGPNPAQNTELIGHVRDISSKARTFRLAPHVEIGVEPTLPAAPHPDDLVSKFLTPTPPSAPYPGSASRPHPLPQLNVQTTAPTSTPQHGSTMVQDLSWNAVKIPLILPSPTPTGTPSSSPSKTPPSPSTPIKLTPPSTPTAQSTPAKSIMPTSPSTPMQPINPVKPITPPSPSTSVLAPAG